MYADLVTAPGFKPGVASAKTPGGFDSHPSPLLKTLTTRRDEAATDGDSADDLARPDSPRVADDFDGYRLMNGARPRGESPG